MRNTNYLTLFVFSFLSMQSCVDVIEPDISDFVPKLVMESNFTADHILEVSVSLTRPVGSLEKENDVDFATVEVYEGSTFIEQLEYIKSEEGQAKYYSINFTPKVGISYTIKVSAEGYSPIEASNIIPEATEIQAVFFDNSVNNDIPTQSTVDFDVEVQFSDRIGLGNYYHVILNQQLQQYEIVEMQEGGNNSPDTIFIGNGIGADLNITLQNKMLVATKHYNGQGILVSDETFDGKALALKIRGDFTFNAEVYIPGSFSIEVRAVSEEYYLYYKTLTEQQNSELDPLDETPIVITNVKGGNGIFGGYNPTINTFSWN